MRNLKYGELTNLIFDAIADFCLGVGDMAMGRGNIYTALGNIIKFILKKRRKIVAITL
ncbi:MAG: hypothetical protein N2482_02980 [Patescibacteria group bacterium]|nr:hypothetical protein [Patescibacteria group bacterium]